MKRSMMMILAISLAVGSMWQCPLAEAQMFRNPFARRPKPLPLPTLKAEKAAAEAISLYDTNEDGKISGEELDASPALKASLAWLDRDGDGGLGAEEIQTQIKAWQAQGVALCTPIINVKLGGKPVKSGEITLTPEPFLGRNFHPAKGKIANGVCSPSCDADVNPEELPGMPWGFYTATFSGIKAPDGSEMDVAPVGVEISNLNLDYQKNSSYELALKPAVKEEEEKEETEAEE